MSNVTPIKEASYHRIASDTYWPPRHPLPGCTGACDQGRNPCQSTGVCYPDTDEPMDEESDALYIALLTAACGVLGFVVYLLITTVQGGA